MFERAISIYKILRFNSNNMQKIAECKKKQAISYEYLENRTYALKIHQEELEINLQIY